MNQQPHFIPQQTNDGSCTFFSPDFEEAFHSYHGAKQEAETKYVEPTMIKQLAQQQNKLQILDICYGLGYNTAAALEAIWSVNPDCQIELIGLEIAPAVPRQAIEHQLLSLWQPEISGLLRDLATNSKVENQRLDAKIIWGDARQTILQIVAQKWLADAIFLDPFSPPKCPQLWTVEFITSVAKCLQPQGRLATYSCAAAIRKALMLAGLQFGSIQLRKPQSPGTVASFQAANIPPLSLQEQEHLVTRGAIPYRDPQLQDSAAQIHHRRDLEQTNSNLESTSQWKKRWLNQK